MYCSSIAVYTGRVQPSSYCQSCIERQCKTANSIQLDGCVVRDGTTMTDPPRKYGAVQSVYSTTLACSLASFTCHSLSHSPNSTHQQRAKEETVTITCHRNPQSAI